MIQPIMAKAAAKLPKQTSIVTKGIPEYVRASSILPKLNIETTKPYEYANPTRIIEKAIFPSSAGQKIDFYAF